MVGGKEDNNYVTDHVDRQTMDTTLLWPMGLNDNHPALCYNAQSFSTRVHCITCKLAPKVRVTLIT